MHACLVGTLASQMPFLPIGRAERKIELLGKLDKVFEETRIKYGFAIGDMPEIDGYRKFLEQANWDGFKKVDELMLRAADRALGEDIPKLIVRAQQIAEDPVEYERVRAIVKEVKVEEASKTWF